MSLNQWETEDMKKKKKDSGTLITHTHTQRNHKQTQTKTPNIFSNVFTQQGDDSLIKSVNGSITGQPPGCQPDCAELSFRGLQLSLPVLTCLVLVPVQNTELQIAQIGLLEDTRSSAGAIFDAPSSERLFFGGRCHLALIHFQCHIRLWRNLHYPKIRGGKKKKKVWASQAWENNSFSHSAWLLWTHTPLWLATCSL